jgi:hypothetical protein
MAVAGQLWFYVYSLLHVMLMKKPVTYNFLYDELFNTERKRKPFMCCWRDYTRMFVGNVKCPESSPSCESDDVCSLCVSYHDGERSRAERNWWFTALYYWCRNRGWRVRPMSRKLVLRLDKLIPAQNKADGFGEMYVGLGGSVSRPKESYLWFP